jgi:LDH2 family malate/lactate/ureidoglycolate dehydrogenase
MARGDGRLPTRPGRQLAYYLSMHRLRSAVREVRRRARASGWLWTASMAADRLGVPTQRLWPDRPIAAPALSDLATSLLRAWGMSEADIAVTVGHVLYADLHGIDSHGCAMFYDYHRELRAGRLLMAAKVEVVREGPATALLDGGGGLGHVPADRAMRLAVDKARETGLGAVAVRNSGHFGAAGSYARLAAAEGLIGMATTSTRIPSVVPTFGVDAVLGTNPISFAAPAGHNRPFLLDMATSTAPLGKVLTAWRAGGRIPEGWAQDPQGRPETNARLAAGYRRLTALGSTREMGSHKGYGLAAMVEILSSVLPGLRRAQEHGPPRAGHFFLALDPARFGDPAAFREDLDALLDSFRASRPAEVQQPVQVAGDPEYAVAEERGRHGIPLSRAVLEDLRLLCAESGVPFPWEKA